MTAAACARCGWEGVLARVAYDRDGGHGRTKPLCLLCRCMVRRLLYRRGATRVVVEPCLRTPAA